MIRITFRLYAKFRRPRGNGRTYAYEPSWLTRESLFILRQEPESEQNAVAILVTCGAGHVGSVTVDLLLERRVTIVISDDLARGHHAALDANVPCYRNRVGDRALFEHITRDHQIKSCIRFAALADRGESVEKLAAKFENNVKQGVALIGALMHAGMCQFVFHPLAPRAANQEGRPNVRMLRSGRETMVGQS